MPLDDFDPNTLSDADWPKFFSEMVTINALRNASRLCGVMVIVETEEGTVGLSVMVPQLNPSTGESFSMNRIVDAMPKIREALGIDNDDGYHANMAVLQEDGSIIKTELDKG